VCGPGVAGWSCLGLFGAIKEHKRGQSSDKAARLRWEGATVESLSNQKRAGWTVNRSVSMIEHRKERLEARLCLCPVCSGASNVGRRGVWLVTDAPYFTVT
jgi:hypothetical protein